MDDVQPNSEFDSFVEDTVQVTSDRASDLSPANDDVQPNSDPNSPGGDDVPPNFDPNSPGGDDVQPNSDRDDVESVSLN